MYQCPNCNNKTITFKDKMIMLKKAKTCPNCNNKWLLTISNYFYLWLAFIVALSGVINVWLSGVLFISVFSAFLIITFVITVHFFSKPKKYTHDNFGK